MFDNWELDNYEIQATHVYTEEQIKRLQERIIVEESDIILTKELFNSETPEKIVKYECNNTCIKTNINKKIVKNKEYKKYNKSPKVFKEHTIINGQKEKNKEKKKEKIKDYHNIYSNSNNYCDDYLDYEDKYSK